jgi:hypothetical protein
MLDDPLPPVTPARPLRKLVYLADWLPPDRGAIGQYAQLEARRRAGAGEEVTLVGLTSGVAGSTEERCGAGLLRVVRVKAPLYDRTRLGRRIGWTIGADLRLLRAGWRWMRRADEVLFTGSPPLMIDFLVPANLLLRRRLTYRLSDFHPEVLIAGLGRAPLPLRLLLAWTRFLRRRVYRLEVLGEDGRRRLAESGVAPGRVAIHRYGSPVEIGPGTRPLERPAEWADRVLLLYSGNYGVVHDDATFIAGYRAHHRAGSGRVVLWLSATGAKADWIDRELRAEGLPVYRTEPVALERLASLLVTPDAHVVTLLDPFVGYVMPSKVFGCIASGKPILFIGSAASDVDRLCRESPIAARYLRVDSGDAAGVAAALESIASLAQDPMGRGAPAR